jgi:hypothetical protein
LIYSNATIRRRYDQGLESIIRLVSGLEERLEELSNLQLNRNESLNSKPKQSKSFNKPFNAKTTK